MPPQHSRRIDDRGSVTSTVLVFPSVLLLLLLATQAALSSHANNVASAAAHDALRAAQGTGGTERSGRQAAAELIDAVAPRLIEQADTNVEIDATNVHVRVVADVVTVLPLPGYQAHVTATASGPVERFTTDDEP